MAISANRGEWAELYALVQLLLNNSVPSLDKALQPIPGKVFQFLELLRKDDGAVLKFVPYDSPLISSGTEPLPNRTDLQRDAESFWRELQSTKGASFESKHGSKLMKSLGIGVLKAQSTEKVDLYARLAGLMGSDDSQLGFSIKSQVGANSTLINASGQTTFEYLVEGGSVDIAKINAISTTSKIRDRVKAIYDSGAKLVFSSVPSSTFQGNLDLVESTLKQSLADLLIVYYTTEKRTVLDAINHLASSSKDPLFEKKLKYSMKNLLRVAALGMMPGTEWDGDLTAYGGYLVVKSDGQLGCFHLQKDDEFKNYLLENTKFETPSGSTGRQPYGELIQTDSGIQFSLRLQIRFI
jgi:hypothetical protein